MRPTRRSAPTARACGSGSSWRRRSSTIRQLLILDEPLAGMDPLARRRTIRMIRDWARAGKSVIVSSHILHEIESMTGNILLINNGRILAEGDIHQIRDLIDEHPHTCRCAPTIPRALAREFLAFADVRSLKFEEGDGDRGDRQARHVLCALTEMAASGEFGVDRRSHVARRQPRRRVPVPGEVARRHGHDNAAMDAVTPVPPAGPPLQRLWPPDPCRPRPDSSSPRFASSISR